MQDAIKIHHLTKTYGKLLAVDNVSLSVKRGAIYGLLGANGAGKSTLLECILGIQKADSGTITVLGCDPNKDRRALFQCVGVQFQESGYPANIKVRELCQVYHHPAPWTSLCQQFGLGGKLNSLVKNLSGGQRQRLSSSRNWSCSMN